MRTRFSVAAALVALAACGDGSGGGWDFRYDPSAAADAGVADASPAPTSSPDSGTSAPAPDAGSDASAAPEPDASTAAAGCTGATLCDDFESYAAGQPPGAPRWTLSSPNCSGAGTIAVDATQAHSGARSVKVTGGGGYCDHVFIATPVVANIRPVLWTRFFIRFDAALGMGHTTFLAMRDATASKDLRMGGQNGVLMFNRESDDATLPDMSPMGVAASVAPAAQRWTCIETRIEPSAGSITAWVDGAPVAGLVANATSTPNIDDQWLRVSPPWSPNLVDARFGWESYAGQAETLWIDDVALGPDRIGCTM